MTRRAVVTVLLTAALLLAACQGLTHRDATKPLGAAAAMRNEGYALLYATINDESQVDQVLKIKDPDPQVAALLKAIGQFARDHKNTLEALAKVDPTLRLDRDGLPKVETATRAAISSATSKQIIFSGGKEFEFRILLTQHQALNYITHLADTLGEQEVDQNRKRYLTQLAGESKALHERVIAQLDAPYVGQSE